MTEEHPKPSLPAIQFQDEDGTASEGALIWEDGAGGGGVKALTSLPLNDPPSPNGKRPWPKTR